MITISDLSLKFDDKYLFKDVNLKFTKGNCYGIIGANGAGKSTFLKILSGEQEHDGGEFAVTPGERMAVLRQDHFAFDAYSVKDTVFMGYPHLRKGRFFGRRRHTGIRAGRRICRLKRLGGRKSGRADAFGARP